MGISQESKNEIHIEVRQELKRLVKTWGALFGTTNLVALIGLGFYVFFLVPKNAVHEAKSQINNELQTLRTNLLSESTGALIDVGKIKGKIEQVAEGIDSLQTEYSDATASLKEIQSGILMLADADREELASIIKRLEKYPETNKLVSGIDSLENEVKEIKNRVRDLEKEHKIAFEIKTGGVSGLLGGHSSDQISIVFSDIDAESRTLAR
jgi:uncharacterized phage infection (PIP) family protein YhgE